MNMVCHLELILFTFLFYTDAMHFLKILRRNYSKIYYAEYWVKLEGTTDAKCLKLPIEKEFVSDLYPLIKEEFSKDLSKGDSFGLHSSKYAAPFEPTEFLYRLKETLGKSPILLKTSQSNDCFSNVRFKRMHMLMLKRNNSEKRSERMI